VQDTVVINLSNLLRFMLLVQVWNKLDNMNEQLAIKRSIQLQSIFGNGDAASAKELVSFLEVQRSFLC
jgi:hypothetical protein